MTLSKASMNKNLAAVKKMKKSALLKKHISEDLTNREIAGILSALNTNSHELDDIGGSGLFLVACMMEHSCHPNCNFHTEGTTIKVTAMEGRKPARLYFPRVESSHECTLFLT